MLESNFWQNKISAQKILKEKKFQEDLIFILIILIKKSLIK